MPALNKKFILTALLVILVISAVAFYFAQRRAKNKTAENPNGSQSGNGGLTQLPTGTANNPPGFQVLTDSSQPYATGKPLGPENPAENNYQPVKSQPQSSTSNQLSAEQAYNQGLIADSNGDYKQTVSGSGFNQYDVNQFADYNLSDADFMQKYFPDYLAFNAGQTPEQQQQEAKDPVQTSSPTVTDIQDTPGVDPGQFNVTPDNSNAAIKAYILQLSDATSSFDLVYNQQLVEDGIHLNTISDINDYYAKTAQTANNIRAIPTPSKMLNFAKAYLNLYQLFAAVLSDEKSLIRNPVGTNPSLGDYSDHTTAFTAELSTVQDNIDTVMNSIQ